MKPEQKIFKYKYTTRIHVPREIKLPTIEGQKDAALELLERTIFNRTIQNFNLLIEPTILNPDDETVLIVFETYFESLKEKDDDRLKKLFSEDYYSKIPVEWNPDSRGMPYKQ